MLFVRKLTRSAILSLAPLSPGIPPCLIIVTRSHSLGHSCGGQALYFHTYCCFFHFLGSCTAKASWTHLEGVSGSQCKLEVPFSRIWEAVAFLGGFGLLGAREATGSFPGGQKILWGPLPLKKRVKEGGPWSRVAMGGCH